MPEVRRIHKGAQLMRQKQRLTKKPNAAVRHSLKHGKKLKVGDQVYCGAVPQFVSIETDILLPARFAKVVKGIPFVRDRQ